MPAIGKNSKSLALVAAPWPLYNRPSIQLGSLKAYLRRRFPEIGIDAHHLYLPLAAALGYDIYQALSGRTWLAEAVYAAVLYPERFERINTLFRRHALKNGPLGKVQLTSLSRAVSQRTDELLDEIDWKNYTMVGFSVSLCQFSATLYMARRVKQINPAVTCLVGGASFSGIPPAPVFELIEEIDLIVSGEGEKPLAHLVQSHLVDGISLKDLEPVAGVHNRYTSAKTPPTGFNQMSSLDQLPPPDYDSYFKCLSKLPSEMHFFATLPIELSRGCWWKRRQGNRKSGCAFCNLNLQWQGYRHKSADQGFIEIDRLTSRHQTLSIAFTDNILPVKTAAGLFESLSRSTKDLRLFGEIRATTRPRNLVAMVAAGLTEVQIGIEALSTSLLQKLNKGTRAIDNLAIMKFCEELGIKHISNLILLVPGSDIQDVEDTLNAIEFASPFRPLKPVDFWLGMGSPLWQHPQESGIKTISNHPNWNYLFPEPMARKFPFSILGYRGDLGRQRNQWRPVRSALKKWAHNWQRLHQGSEKRPILSFRDGREFLIIRQRRVDGPALTHRLTGMSASIYRQCRLPESIDDICLTHKTLAPEKIKAFLKMMVAKKLMYAEKDDYLSLALQERRIWV